MRFLKKCSKPRACPRLLDQQQLNKHPPCVQEGKEHDDSGEHKLVGSTHITDVKSGRISKQPQSQKRASSSGEYRSKPVYSYTFTDASLLLQNGLNTHELILKHNRPTHPLIVTDSPSTNLHLLSTTTSSTHYSSSSVKAHLGDGLRNVVEGVNLIVVEDDPPPLFLVQLLLVFNL